MRLTIFWLGAAAFAVLAIMRISDPLVPMVAEEFDRSVGEVSIIVMAFAVPYGLMQVFYGPMGDRFGKLKVIAITLAIGGLSTMAGALATDIVTLSVYRFLSGATIAGAIPLSIAYIGDNVPFAERQSTIGRYMTGTIVGIIFGSAAAGVIADLLGWRQIFFWFGLMTVVVAAIVFASSFKQTETVRQVPLWGRALFAPYLNLLRIPSVQRLVIAAIAEGFSLFAAVAYMGAALRDVFGLEFAVIGLLLGLVGIGGLIYVFAIERMLTLFNEKQRIIWGSLLVGSTYAVINSLPHWTYTIPAFLIYGFGFYLMHTTFQNLASEMSNEHRGTAVSLFVFSLFAGLGLGSIVIGLMIDQVGYPVTYIFNGVGVAILGIWFTRGMNVDEQSHATGK